MTPQAAHPPGPGRRYSTRCARCNATEYGCKGAVMTPAATAGSLSMKSRAASRFAASKMTTPKVAASASVVRPAEITWPCAVALFSRSTWKPPLTAQQCGTSSVNVDVCHHDEAHLMGDTATRPIEPRWRTLAVLLRQGGDALACARHKQSSGLFVSGHSLAGGYPASSLRLASAPHRSPLGRVQLRFRG